MVQYAAVDSHLGSNYVAEINSEVDITLIEQVCDRCFDSDFVLGVYDTYEEAENHLR